MIYFNGFTTLSINVPVYGEISSLLLINDTESAVMLVEGMYKCNSYNTFIGFVSNCIAQTQSVYKSDTTK